jgi:hypothetical protein
VPFETPVIPAKAEIQSVDSAFPKVCRVDSRFRGNDCGLERPCPANDTSTRQGWVFPRTEEADCLLITADLMTRPFSPRVSSESAWEADSLSLDRRRKIG